MNRLGPLASCLLVLGALLSTQPMDAHAQTGTDWQSDWSVRRGYVVKIDAPGFSLPTSIAIVPEPGNGPKDPAYFVTELKGTVKVVTNDRSILTFASGFFNLRPVPWSGAADSLEVGLTGICLEPRRGYVFVTFTYHDARGGLRNSVTRFLTRPGVFAVAPVSSVDFRDIFASDRANASHQIGPCRVYGDHLYVAVGDGEQPNQSRRLDSTLGKILRMTLDGSPPEDNPFYTKAKRRAPAAFVWAYGFRNPFGLEIMGGKVFAVDNGASVDRFVRVEKGEDYLWAGSDRAIGTKAIAVLSPSAGVAQLGYASRSYVDFPGGFYFNVTGSPVGLNRDVPPQIVRIDYSIPADELLGVPEPFLRYRGSQVQVLVGLAFGHDGLYFVPLLPNQTGMSAVFKIERESASNYPFVLEEEVSPRILMGDFCRGCHNLSDEPKPKPGPNLTRTVLTARLERLGSKEYAESLALIDELREEPFVSFRSARREVLQARGTDKLEVWLKYRVLEPRFDTTSSLMPNLGLSEREAGIIANFLVSEVLGENRGGALGLLRRFTPERFRLRHLAVFSAGGFAAGAVSVLFLFVMRRGVNRYRNTRNQGQ